VFSYLKNIFGGVLFLLSSLASMKMSVLERKNFCTWPLDALIKIRYSKGLLEVLLLPLLSVEIA